MHPLAPFFETQGYAMLDGGLSTQLERLGANLEGELWTSRVLLDAPERVKQAHMDFLEGGADVIATATYQASVEGFERAGLDKERGAELMREAISIAVSARDEFWLDTANRQGRIRPLVAASLGPFGACLHDGSEYHGNYGLAKDALADFHRPRIAHLENSGADLFAFETIPSLLEARAIIELLTEFPGIRAWLSFSCRDDTRVAHGEPFADCARTVAGCDQILAVGVNCTAPENIPPLLASAQDIDIPLAAYPNSGEHWDAAAQKWAGDACDSMDVALWHHLGARLIGGCCRTDSNDIRTMKSALGAALS